ncbi:MAG TPA: hypothetical protein VK137_16770, partial [Planctomycetaceae bacterium]|nr:hypothetical protein [Planctomycetaceae bacterium]
MSQLNHRIECRVAPMRRVPQQHPEAGNRRGEAEVRRGLCERAAVVGQRLLDELALVGVRLFVAELDRQQFVFSWRRAASLSIFPGRLTG